MTTPLTYLTDAQRGGYGCATCWPGDATDAVAAAWRLRLLFEITDDSHFHQIIVVCESCGQQFRRTFRETVDFENGDDAQSWAWSPLSASEVRAITKEVPDIEAAFTGILGLQRFQLVYDHPTGEAPQCYWTPPPLIDDDAAAEEYEAPLGVHVLGFGATAEALALRLLNVVVPTPSRGDQSGDGAPPPIRSTAFVIMSAETHEQVARAVASVATLREHDAFVVGLAINACPPAFVEAVDIVLRVAAEHVEGLVRVFLGAQGSFGVTPLNLADIRLLMHGGGEAVVAFHTTDNIDAFGECIRLALRDVRDRGALTDDEDWLFVLVRDRALFSIFQDVMLDEELESDRAVRSVRVGVMSGRERKSVSEVYAIARVCPR
ncbi:MAG: hypothetical protein IT353_23445 [Gemmatimonadaceae bacterium]|nr:hypothetical protein [Gemmatimonadaceae bacterium]